MGSIPVRVTMKKSRRKCVGTFRISPVGIERPAPALPGEKCPADIFSDYRKIVSLRASAHTGVAIRFLLYFRIHRKMKKLKPVMRAKAGQIICPTTASPSVPQSGRTAVPPGQPVPGTPLRNLLPGTVPCIPPDSSVSGGNSGAAGAW